MIRLVYDKLGETNCSKCPGINDTDGLQYMLWAHNCVHIVQPVQDVPKDTVSFYPVAPVHFDESFGAYGKSLIDYIPPYTYNRLKDPEDKLKLLIFYPFEGYDIRTFKHVTVVFLNSLYSKYGIPLNKVFMCYGDLNIRNTLATSEVKCEFPLENILGVDIFEYVAYLDSRHSERILPDRTPTVRPKHFLYKNGVARMHRIFTAGALKSKGLLDNMHFSWLNTSKFDYEVKSKLVENTFAYYNNGNTNYEYYHSFLELIKNEPYFIDITDEEATDRRNQITSTESLYTSSYVSLVTETLVDEFNTGVKFISEKTYQPIYNFHPFIIMGSKGVLEHLHNDGYETYPEFFDESYDLISNHGERVQAIITEVEKFCKMDIKELNNIYYSDYITDKFYHNWRTFVNNGGRRSIREIYNWLLEVK